MLLILYFVYRFGPRFDFQWPILDDSHMCKGMGARCLANNMFLLNLFFDVKELVNIFLNIYQFVQKVCVIV